MAAMQSAILSSLCDTALAHTVSIFGDRYTPERVIASAEHGVLVLARNNYSKRTVAIRTVWRGNTERWQEDLAVEVAVMRSLQHPNILNMEAVHIFSLDEVQIVTEVADWKLQDLLCKCPQASESMVQAIVFQLLDCSDYMTRSGVAHTDIRLETVLVNANCEVKLAGFAHTQELHSRAQTTFADSTHTPPEILSGQSLLISEKTDIWQIGIVFLELLLWGDLSKSIRQLRDSDFQHKVLCNYLPQVACSESRSLVTALLQRDPRKRLTAREALAHPYFHSLTAGEELEQLQTTDVAEVVARIRNAPSDELDRFLLLEASN